jgi:hypothetical protein
MPLLGGMTAPVTAGPRRLDGEKMAARVHLDEHPNKVGLGEDRYQPHRIRLVLMVILPEASNALDKTHKDCVGPNFRAG